MTTTLLRHIPRDHAAASNGSLPFPKPPLALPEVAVPRLALPTPTWKKDLYREAQLGACPFCGAPAMPPEPTTLHSSPEDEHSIACLGEDCMAVMFGRTLIEAITRWNKRAILTEGRAA